MKKIRLPKIKVIARAALALLVMFALAINLIPALCLSIPTNPIDNKKYDAIVVLGYPALANGKPSPMLERRVMAAIDLYQHQHADRLILTGGAAHNRFVEAAVMSDLARSNGVPAASIILETKAQNTCQNAANSVAIMQQHHWHSAIVVSSPNHLNRASYLFARYAIDFAVASAGYPAEMDALERLLFEQYERYALTRIALMGAPNCSATN